MDKGECLAAGSAEPCSLNAILIDLLVPCREVEAALAGSSWITIMARFHCKGLWRSPGPTSSSKQDFTLHFWKTYHISGDAPINPFWNFLGARGCTLKQPNASESFLFLGTPWDKTSHRWFLTQGQALTVMGERCETIHHSSAFVQVLMGHRCHGACQPLLWGAVPRNRCLCSGAHWLSKGSFHPKMRTFSCLESTHNF